MASYRQASNIESQEKVFFDTKDLAIFLNLDGRTLENTIKRLVVQQILTVLERGKYYVTSKTPSDFQIAYFLYNPSYISFETALSYHGVLSQFPTVITSVTTRRSRTKVLPNKEYTFSHIQKGLYIGYIKKDGFLLATPEKALVDQIYFSLKSLKSIQNLDEYNLNIIDAKKVYEFLNLMSAGYKKSLWKF